VWQAVKDLQKADKSLAEKVGAIEVLVAGNYVKKEELAESIKALFAKLDKIAQDTADEVNASLDGFGGAVVKNAKLLVSTNSSDEGGLLGSIDSTVNSLSVTITSNRNYAAYIEFGTRKFAASYISSLPSEWQAYAGTFRGDKTGDSGDFNDFVQAIMAWAQRKGIGALKTKSGRNSQSASSYDSMQQKAIEKFCKNTDATDETIEMLLLHSKQLSQYIIDLKAIQPVVTTEPDLIEAIQSFRKTLK